jgi:hypothetical protein
LLMDNVKEAMSMNGWIGCRKGFWKLAKKARTGNGAR